MDIGSANIFLDKLCRHLLTGYSHTSCRIYRHRCVLLLLFVDLSLDVLSDNLVGTPRCQSDFTRAFSATKVGVFRLCCWACDYHSLIDFHLDPLLGVFLDFWVISWIASNFVAMLSIGRLFVGFDFAETLYVHWLRNNPCYFDCDDLKGPCLFEFLWKKPLILNEMSAYFFFFNYLMMLPIVLLLILNIQINFIVLLLFLFIKVNFDRGISVQWINIQWSAANSNEEFITAFFFLIFILFCTWHNIIWLELYLFLPILKSSSLTLFNWYLVYLWQLALLVVNNTFDQILTHSSFVFGVQLNGSHLLLNAAGWFFEKIQVLVEGHIHGDLQSTVTFRALSPSPFSFNCVQVLLNSFDHIKQL